MNESVTESIMQEWDAQQSLQKKYRFFAENPHDRVSAEVKLRQLIHGANTGHGQRLCSYNPGCGCAECAADHARQRARQAEWLASQANQPKTDDADIDYFGRLAQQGNE